MFDAALAIYAERGWYGFSLEAVARQAGVGQSAVYRRWATRAELLAAAVSYHEPALPDIDTGTTRGDLVELTRYFILSYRGDNGVAGLRMVLDARAEPEIAEQFGRRLAGPVATEARRLLRQGKQRGDLAPALSVDLALEIVSGATLSHVLYSARPASKDADERFVQRLVDSMLVER